MERRTHTVDVCAHKFLQHLLLAICLFTFKSPGELFCFDSSEFLSQSSLVNRKFLLNTITSARTTRSQRDHIHCSSSPSGGTNVVCTGIQNASIMVLQRQRHTDTHRIKIGCVPLRLLQVDYQRSGQQNIKCELEDLQTTACHGPIDALMVDAAREGGRGRRERWSVSRLGGVRRN